MDNLSVFGDIGTVLGYPAMLLIFWLYNKVKEMEKRLNEGNGRFKEQDEKFEKVKNDMAEKFENVKDDMADIRDDVKFIRGFLEGKTEVDSKK